MPQRAKDIALSLVNGNPNNKTKKELFKRKKNKENLQLSTANLTPPSWLSTGAKKDFNRIIHIFAGRGIFNDADVDTLAIYCDTLADYKSYKNQIKKHGMMLTDIKGNQYLNPFVKEKRNAAKLLDKIANELGLSPSARTSMAVNLPVIEEDDEFD